MARPGSHLPAISPAQCRAARAVLRMTVTDTCAAAEVARATLIKFEAGNDVRPIIVERLRQAFEQRGFSFAATGKSLDWAQVMLLSDTD